ncbi:hypothetical protein ARALYDRAFT_901108 [Arabidopsis lyrata subsp. lyrata]|uniref:MADS-box domain-containing protein n=1 Tax=Arabidopsis lyrata subsp. lyrata TaxID=81972 RepID=D7LJI5_ARALL|nr:hypothetical protein ARALYDRAFT_901108 [Arabidopsis lyrata subsp. lyrata]
MLITTTNKDSSIAFLLCPGVQLSSKSSSCLFKKASELCTLCDVETVIIIFSQGGNFFSFGHPNINVLLDHSRGRVLRDNNTNLAESNMKLYIQMLNESLIEHFLAGINIRKFLNVDADAVGPSTNLKMTLFEKLEEGFLCQGSNHGDKIGYLTELRMLTYKFIDNHKGKFLLEV